MGVINYNIFIIYYVIQLIDKDIMDRFKIGFLILFIIISITTIPLLGAQIMAQNPGVIPIDPKNVTNQTLQGYPTEDKDMSTGIENE